MPSATRPRSTAPSVGATACPDCNVTFRRKARDTWRHSLIDKATVALGS